jgi:hypothetical protein
MRRPQPEHTPPVKTEVMRARVGPDLRRRVEAAAARAEMSPSEFIRFVLQDYLARTE